VVLTTGRHARILADRHRALRRTCRVPKQPSRTQYGRSLRHIKCSFERSIRSTGVSERA
jgi:hypothetical protein